MRYITPSILLAPETREMLSNNEVLYFSGQPLWHSDGDKTQRYDACDVVFDIPLFVQRAVVNFSQSLREPNSHGTCSGDFIAIIGSHIVSEDTYCFGIRPDYEFTMSTEPEPTE